MKKLSVCPIQKINKTISVPGDKSISHRAIMIGALANGQTTITNFLASADCLATIECLRKMGADIQMTNDQCQMSNECKIIINGKGLHGLEQPKEELYVGNSGTTIRLLSGILAGQDFTTIITGDESIQKRPMLRVAKPLREMGASFEGRIEKENLFAPLRISGGDLRAIEYNLPVPSAQVKSAVLLAGLFAKGETVVVEKNQSRDHTERMLSFFKGQRHEAKGIRPQVVGGEEFSGTEIDVPGDISSAAFLLAAGLLTPNSELRTINVGLNPTRTGIIDVFHRMGANLEIENEILISNEPRGEIVCRSSKLKGIKIDGEIIPRIIDEIPIIAVVATQAEGRTEIRGAKELRIKESDRIATICAELKKFGAHVKELDDGLIIDGPTALSGAEIESHGDHRIAMAMAIAGLIAEGETVINDTACIETSFPGFEGLLLELS
jgi:3-phosphoshikimate 1-carboxyvinyltransferase